MARVSNLKTSPGAAVGRPRTRAKQVKPELTYGSDIGQELLLESKATLDILM